MNIQFFPGRWVLLENCFFSVSSWCHCPHETSRARSLTSIETKAQGVVARVRPFIQCSVSTERREEKAKLVQNFPLTVSIWTALPRARRSRTRTLMQPARAHLARRLVIQACMDETHMVSIRVDLDCFTSGFEQSTAVSDENADAARTPTHCARCMRTSMDEKPLSSHAVLLSSSALMPANSGGGRLDAAAAGSCGGNRDGPFATTRKDADAFVRSPHFFPGFDPMAPEASRRRCREASSVSAVDLKNAIQTRPHIRGAPSWHMPPPGASPSRPRRVLVVGRTFQRPHPLPLPGRGVAIARRVNTTRVNNPPGVYSRRPSTYPLPPSLPRRPRLWGTRLETEPQTVPMSVVERSAVEKVREQLSPEAKEYFVDDETVLRFGRTMTGEVRPPNQTNRPLRLAPASRLLSPTSASPLGDRRVCSHAPRSQSAQPLHLVPRHDGSVIMRNSIRNNNHMKRCGARQEISFTRRTSDRPSNNTSAHSLRRTLSPPPFPPFFSPLSCGDQPRGDRGVVRVAACAARQFDPRRHVRADRRGARAAAVRYLRRRRARPPRLVHPRDARQGAR